MKHFKRILSLLLAALLSLGVLLPAHAALPSDLYIETIGSATGLFEVRRTTTWDPLPVPFWASLEDDALAYCLESDRDQPKGDDYSVSQAFYTTRTLTGVQAILMHGAPNDFGGLTTVQACYATQVAIWCWMYESASVGYFFYDTSRLRPASGNQAVYDFFLSLLNKARNGNTSVNHGISVTPSTVTLTESGGVLTGTATVRFTNLNGNYAIDQSKVPTGVTVRGSSYDDGDTITITAPMSYAGQTVSMKGVVVARDTRDPANVFWYEPDKGDTQRLVVYDYSLQPVLWADLAFTSIAKGGLDILKTVAGGGSLAGFQFEISKGGTVIGTYTTDAQGRVSVKDLTAGTYSVKEVNLPAEYVTPANNPRQVEIVAGQTATLDWENVKKQGRISIRKTNAAPANGSYSLTGAVFEIFDGNSVLVDTVTTNAEGAAQSKLLALGSYVVKEKTAPTGFLLNTGSFPVTLSAENSTAEVIIGEVSVPEQPQQGRITITKANAAPALGDYSLSGAVFEILDSSRKLIETVTTNAQGIATSGTLNLGAYTVRETAAPHGYVRNSTEFSVQLAYAGQTVQLATASVDVPQQPQVGVIRLAKVNATPSMGDYSLAGAVFEVRNSAGTLVDTITTNSDGKANSKQLPLGSYTVSEKTAPTGFVRNKNSFNAQLTYAGQDVEIVYSDVTVPERPQTGKITVTKRDSVTGDIAQGDAVLNGAVFEVYAEDKTTLMDTIYCGTANKATTKELPLGTFWIKEKASPAGYNLETSMQKAVIAYGNQDVEVVLVDGEVKNKVIEGQIAIVKHTDEAMEGYDDPQIERPLAKAVFEIYLKSAGSYAAAKETERDRFSTNENGYAISKKLPYGLYTVAEVEAEGDVKLVGPFNVFISEEGKIYRFILNDPAYTARVKIVKVDSGTGKVIPAAGTSFKIKNLTTGEWVRQSVWYPAPAQLDTFETGPDGTLMLPEPLPSGNFELYEIKSPYGYLLSEAPVKFTIHSGQQEAVVTVRMENKPVVGKLSLEKQGEMLVGVNETDTAWGKKLVPVFGMKGLVGAEFDIIAAENIVTPDGTVRARKGEVVDHIVTSENGAASTKALYLGNYLVVETRCPASFVLDTEKHPVSLVYAGQNTAVVTSQIGLDNARQTVEISLSKDMERPANAPEGFNPFADVVFGLFAAEGIGGILPKDALVGIVTLDADGRGMFGGDLPFGKFYAKELQTNPLYRLNETAYPVDAAYAGQDKAVAKVQVNNGEAIPNELKQGRIVLEKRGEMLVGATKTKDGYTPVYELRGLQGATFNILDINGAVVDTITTGQDGRAESRLLPLSRYEIVETAAPAGFVLLNAERRSVNLGFDGQVEEIATAQATVTNERQKAEIQVRKSWELPATPPKDFAPWKDITFGLYAKADIPAADGKVAIPAGALIETIAIDKDGSGKARTDLPLAEYFIKELTTAKGYVLDNTAHAVVFSGGGKPIVVKAENKLQRGSLRIVKTFEGRKEPLEGVPFLVVGQTAFGEVRYEAKTAKNGEIVLNGLPVGTYTVTEQKSDITASYVLSPAQTVAVTAGNETVLRITNQLAKGEIRVLKTDKETGKPLEGAMFGLYKDGKLIAEAKSGKDGYAIFKDVEYGEFEIRELSPPVGYNRSEDVLKAIVGKDGSVVLLELANELIPGEPVQPEEPETPVDVPGPEKLPKTGDSNTIVVIALVVLILAGGAVLWLRKRGKDEEPTEEPTEKEELS